jgi:hypothetical protein
VWAVLDVHFVILGAACGLAGQGWYVRDTLRGTTQPNRVTWTLWGAAPMLAFAVEVHDRVGLRSLMTFTVGVGPLVVVAASLLRHRGGWRAGPLEWVCGGLSVAGTAIWLGTRQGLVAIAASIAADALAAVPTVVKSWRAPETESVSAFLGSALNALLTLLTVTTVSAAVVAFPAYIGVVASTQVLLVGGRLGPRLRSAAAAAARSRTGGAVAGGPRAETPTADPPL